MKRRPSRPALVVAVAGVAAVAAGVGYATSAHNGPAQAVIHACKHRVNGRVRIVDENQRCRRNEEAVS